jgi:exodeoxyribonuclease V beta subunit
VIFHDTNQAGKLVMDIGSADREAHKRIAEREDLGGNARLIYVALTRAEYRCVLGVGCFSRCGESRLGVFVASREVEARQPCRDVNKMFSALSDETIWSDLDSGLPEAGARHCTIADVPSSSPEITCLLPDRQSRWPVATLKREIPKDGVSQVSVRSLPKGSRCRTPDRDSIWDSGDEGQALATAACSIISGVSARPSGRYSAARAI